MGNSSSKDTHGRGPRRLDEPAEEAQHRPTEQGIASLQGIGDGSRRGSRHEITFLNINRDRTEPTQRLRETRQEREARRAERERQARLKERERSVKEENVDGGYLVTLGTYTGAEDFSKPIVRQLQIERRLAPFWKGLNDHSDSWTEHQLVAAVRGLPIPAADEIPPEARSPTQSSQNLAVPEFPSIRSDSQLSSSHPQTSSAPMMPLGTSPFFRGRSKTLASLTGQRPLDLTPQEIQLPPDPQVNGLPIEAYLYREPSECPICFLYYPPYLNKTRCCDQPICSECFVQIKRPDPHPPEHEQPGEPRRPEEEAELLVSEVAACPFCVAPEFGITYESPPFRRGLAYSNSNSSPHTALSAASSQTSFHSGERRRTISISHTAPEVVTTDKVRPDWAQKLADARAHALRRSAAATALHNAAYVLGNQESIFRAGYGRRRRSIFAETPGSSGAQTPDNNDMFPGRTSSRRNRVEDLEDLMMMEAIRLSLAAEEERKRKEDKEKAKEDKKKAKEAKKEAKQLEKLNRKGGSSTSLYKTHSNDSTSTWATTSMARSTSNLGSQPSIPEGSQGKGKAPAGTVDASRSRSVSTTTSISGNAQRHLEESRANIQSSTNPISMPNHRHHARQLSNASSLASSSLESAPGSYRAESPSPGFDQDERTGTPPANPAGSLEPMLNFRSLAAMIDDETKVSDNEHMLGTTSLAEKTLKEPSPPRSPTASITLNNRNRNDAAESSTLSSGDDIRKDDQKSETDVHVSDHGRLATQ